MSATEKLKETLEKKAGPLKVWQWGAVAAGGLVAYLVLGRGGSGSSALTAADAALPASDSGSSGPLASVAPGSLVLYPMPIDPLIVTAQPVSDTPPPVMITSPDAAVSSSTSEPAPVVDTSPTVPEPQTDAGPPQPKTVGGISTTYVDPYLTPELVAGGGPMYHSPTTSGAFVPPFQGPTATEITPVAESPAAGLAQPGSQIETLGGVSESLSAAAIARGGIPAKDFPLQPFPQPQANYSTPAPSGGEIVGPTYAGGAPLHVPAGRLPPPPGGGGFYGG